MQTYLFYDIETTGLNKAFDQVLHFAAIRTDLNLKELRRYELKIKLNPDVIPSPGAILTHKMGIKEISQGLSEFEAITQIHQWLNEPGTISLGYNTLGFDDEFLRFSFYRNLLKPYTHQYANQCGRMDIYPMAVMFFLFKNDAIKWPQASLKLENINIANQFVSGSSHHAMVDVEVTLALARHFKEAHEMWEYLHGYFNKQIDAERTRPLQENTALLVDGLMGSEKKYCCPVMFLGQHRHYKNQAVWLRLDSPELMQTAPNEIRKTTWAINKKPGEPNFILPCKERFMQHVSAETLTLTEANQKWLHQHPELLTRITDYYLDYKYPVYPNTDIDARLYLDGFFSPEEETFCRAFHRESPDIKARLLEQSTWGRVQTLALRILGRHFPQALSQKQREIFAEYLAEVNAHNPEAALIDYKGAKRMTPQAALGEIEALRKKAGITTEELALLVELEEVLMQKLDRPNDDKSLNE